METGDGEDGRVLVRRKVLLPLVVAVFVGFEPRLPFDIEEREQLYSQDDYHVAQERGDGAPRNELVLRRLLVELGVGFCS